MVFYGSQTNMIIQLQDEISMIYIETFNILDLFKIYHIRIHIKRELFSSDIMEEIIKTFTFNDVR